MAEKFETLDSVVPIVDRSWFVLVDDPTDNREYIESERAFTGKSRPVRSQLGKLQTGKLAEAITARLTGAQLLNINRNNFPVDLIAGDTVYEVKAGLISNRPDAQKWRPTLGEPGKKEGELVSRMSGNLKSAWSRRKIEAAFDRKRQALKDLGKKIGRPLKSKTVALIIDPDRRVADVYELEGFHQTIRWHGSEARQAYKGTFKFASELMKFEYSCVYCGLKRYHLPGQHDQCDHSPTGECVDPTYKGAEDVGKPSAGSKSVSLDDDSTWRVKKPKSDFLYHVTMGESLKGIFDDGGLLPGSPSAGRPLETGTFGGVFVTSDKQKALILANAFRDNAPETNPAIIQLFVPKREQDKLDIRYDEIDDDDVSYIIRNKLSTKLILSIAIEDPSDVPKKWGGQVVQKFEAYQPSDSDDPGVMVVLKVPPDVAEQLVVPKGNLAEDMHCTLAYLGRLSVVQPRLDRARDAVRAVSDRHPALKGRVSGLGRFAASDSSDGKEVVYATLDVPRLGDLQVELAATVRDNGVEIVSDHGFIPHITVSYVEPGEKIDVIPLPDIPVSFDRLYLWWGDHQEEFRLG